MDQSHEHMFKPNIIVVVIIALMFKIRDAPLISPGSYFFP